MVEGCSTGDRRLGNWDGQDGCLAQLLDSPLKYIYGWTSFKLNSLDIRGGRGLRESRRIINTIVKLKQNTCKKLVIK